MIIIKPEEIEFIEHSLLELKNLAPKLGEVSELEELQLRLKSSSRINEYIQGAANLISGVHVRDDLVVGLNKLEKACELLPNNKLLLATIRSLEGLIHELDEIEKNIPTILRERANEENIICQFKSLCKSCFLISKPKQILIRNNYKCIYHILTFHQRG